MSRNFVRQRYDALGRLIDLLLADVYTLAVYSQLPNTRRPGVADASLLPHSICNFEFTICMFIAKERL